MNLKEFAQEENVSFWKNMFLAVVFFTITPITLLVSLFSLFSIKGTVQAKENVNQKNLAISPYTGVQVYASLPPQLPMVTDAVGGMDARSEIVRQYLEFYKSPLIPYADTLIQISDKYGLDYRLLPAIAQQESNLCKIIPPESHNCWGWGIHSQGSLGFDSYEEAIEAVSKGLRTQYLDKGLSSVPEIMSKYNATSPEGAWAKGVSQFMEEME